VAVAPDVDVFDAVTLWLWVNEGVLLTTTLTDSVKVNRPAAFVRNCCKPAPAAVADLAGAGRVVGRGDHDALLALGGLFTQQYRGGLVEARCADGRRLADGRVLATTPQP